MNLNIFNISATALVISGFLLSSCSGQSAQMSKDDSPTDQCRGTLVASIEPLRRLVAEVAGENWEVVSLTGYGANPESFDPTASTIRKAASADLIFTTGELGFENLLAEKLAGTTSAFDNLIELSEYIDPLTGTHTTHSHTGSSSASSVDPHIWNSLINAAAIVKGIGMCLAETDDTNAHEYRERADSIAAVYLASDSILRSRLKSGSAFLVGHPSFSYFARDYGLRQIAVGEEHKELSVQAMRKAVEDARNSGVAVYLAENEADSLRATTIAKQAGIEVRIVNPLSSDITATLLRAASFIR